jgi:hypothetical protein
MGSSGKGSQRHAGQLNTARVRRIRPKARSSRWRVNDQGVELKSPARMVVCGEWVRTTRIRSSACFIRSPSVGQG